MLKAKKGTCEKSAGSAKHVWIINHHAMIPSKDGTTGRHLDLAQALKEYGWTASLIIASTRHPSGTQAMPNLRWKRISSECGIRVLWVRTLAYGGSTLRRYFGMMFFTLAVLMPGMVRGLRAPDVIIGSTVHPFAAWAALSLARRYNVPFVYEVRDVWPDTLIDLGQVRPNGLLARILRKLDIVLVRNADLVLSPLPFVSRHLAEIGYSKKRFLWVSNGVPQASVKNKVVQSAREQECANPFKFMYLGAHGRANGIDCIIEAFDMACQQQPDLNIELVFVGEGVLKAALAESVAVLCCAPKVRFEERVPRNRVVQKAREADCLVVNLLDKPVYRFGVSLNKFFTYLAASRPSIVASSAPNNPVAEAGAGITVPGDDRLAMAEAMISMAQMPLTERIAMGQAGVRELRRYYTFDKLAHRLALGLDELAPTLDTQRGA